MTKNKYSGFTLIEVLVAAAIIGVLSVVSIQLLFDTISVKSKQQTLETSSDNAYVVIEQIAKSVKEAKSINVTDSGAKIEIVGRLTCVNYRFNSVDNSVEKAVDSASVCIPTAYSSISQSDFKITNLSFSPVGPLPSNISILLEGEVKGTMGEHPFSYQTNIYPRVGM
jgi:prepilin-type N-terminal cleavage/methylation domain-containing protein